MKHSRHSPLPICTILLLLTGFSSFAQTPYVAKAQTVLSAGIPTLQSRLFTSMGVSASVGSTIWIVADTARDGVPTSPSANQILKSDDVVLYKDVVDGSLFGSQAGRYQRSITVSDTVYTNANIYVYLWNGTGVDFLPQQGSTFGIYNIGTVIPPQIGNADWLITSDVLGDQHMVQGPVVGLPEITVQPSSQTNKTGGSVTLSVQATGTEPLTYQWRRNGTNILGATSATLTLNNLSAADAGTYVVLVTSAKGDALSTSAQVTVNTAPAAQPQLSGVVLQKTETTQTFVFNFSTELGSQYQVEYTTNLVGSPVQWSNIGTPITGTAGTAQFATQISDQPDLMRFYRVKTQ